MSAWPELDKEIRVELEQLNELLTAHRPLLNKCRTTPPDAIERSALAAVLHAFYNGVENILTRIAVHADGGTPQASTWHQDLLKSMSAPAPGRSAAISPQTRDRLTEYLAFRHVFRHSYTYQLRWEKMRHLVWGLDETLQELQREFTEFLGRHRAK